MHSILRVICDDSSTSLPKSIVIISRATEDSVSFAETYTNIQFGVRTLSPGHSPLGHLGYQ